MGRTQTKEIRSSAVLLLYARDWMTMPCFRAIADKVGSHPAGRDVSSLRLITVSKLSNDPMPHCYYRDHHHPQDPGGPRGG